ncbi:hypothetical protein AI27_17830 [Sphingomonas sp. BHC-A]|nr:hypothetical protein AI27_17830 [Sphingomonas sp. BHC-A]
MADTNWQDFPDSAPQAADIFLAMRGAGGVNSTMAQIAAFAAANAGDGTVGAPGHSFASDPDTGFYRPGANLLGVVTAGAERVRVDASGNVGIGVTPSRLLHIGGRSSPEFLIQSSDAASWKSRMTFGNAAVKWEMGSDIGNVGNNNFYWYDAVAGAERMRISSSGNLGIGVSGDAAEALHIARPGWCLQRMQNSAGIANLGVVNGTGDFAIDASTSGKNIYFQTAGVERARITAIDLSVSVNVVPLTDNSRDLGWSGGRFRTIYAATGTINTSDEREKLWRGFSDDLKAKVRRIADAILDELGHFQFLSSIEEKGEDGARWHFGARAQVVWGLVAAEGLCAPLIGEGSDQQPDPNWTGAPPPAWLCWDVWEDRHEPIMEEQQIGTETVVIGQEPTGLLDAAGAPMMRDITEERPVMGMVEIGQELVQAAGNRFGLRIDQIALLVAWVQREREMEIHALIADLATRVVSLEAAA